MKKRWKKSDKWHSSSVSSSSLSGFSSTQSSSSASTSSQDGFGASCNFKSLIRLCISSSLGWWCFRRIALKTLMHLRPVQACDVKVEPWHQAGPSVSGPGLKTLANMHASSSPYIYIMQKRDRCMDNHNSRRSFGYALPVWEQQHEDPNARRQVSRICNSPALCHGKLWCRLFAPKLMEHDYIHICMANNFTYEYTRYTR